MHSWRFSVVSRRKLLLKSRDPIARDRTIDLAIARYKVNAANKNKRVLFDRRSFERMNWLRAARTGKECFRVVCRSGPMTGIRFCTLSFPFFVAPHSCGD
jgi:hypothetical protein